MAIIVADVTVVHDAADPSRALVTLSILTGIVMVVAGLLRLGGVLRFVSNAVLVGFINAVGVNIILGQLENVTGYSSDAGSRVTRALDTLLHPGRLDGASVAVGIGTIVLILVLERTPLGSLGLVVAVVATSALVSALSWDVATVHDLGVPLGSLPGPMLPDVTLVPELLVPALSLALVGLVQGAGISANFPNEDGTYPDASRDFVGQGVANVASGVFQGMPVGGSVSGTSLNKTAGARTRVSLVIAGLLMAIIVVAFGDAVGKVAMPALGGLLMLIGYRTIRPQDLVSVWKTGTAQRIVLVITFVLTMTIPLQYAVVCGVALSVALYVIGQSNKVTVRRRVLDESGGAIETDPPEAPSSPRGRDTPALRQPVLRRRTDLRGSVARSDVGVARLRGHPEASGAQRRRIDVHRRPAPICGPAGGRRFEACPRIGEPAPRGAVPRHRVGRDHRCGQHLRRPHACGTCPRAGESRCAGVGCITTRPRRAR